MCVCVCVCVCVCIHEYKDREIQLALHNDINGYTTQRVHFTLFFRIKYQLV